MKQAFPFSIGTVHIIGIGGIGMSGYAEILHNLGYKVQGSDISENANVKRLRDLGIRIMVRHSENNIYDEEGELCSVIVKSTAVKDDNLEIIRAKELAVPIIKRVALLAEIMRFKWCINVSGTHGKTTTTSMIGHTLEKANFDPTVINGGIINSYNSNIRMGTGNWMVVEADESDGTFTKLPSVASIITNIDPEHMDYYGTFNKLKEAFITSVHNLPFYGFVVACIDHPVVAELMPKFRRKTITYGFSEEADIRASNVKTTPEGVTYDVEFTPLFSKFKKKTATVKLPMFGTHNVLNSLTNFAIGHELGIALDQIISSLSELPGVKRRFTTTGIVNDITIIDDYAHHPVEIETVLKAGRDIIDSKGCGRLIAVAQPHRYSRLENLFDSFSTCFNHADNVIITAVHPAGENPIPGIDHLALASSIKKNGKEDVHTINQPEDLAPLLQKIAKPGDIIICMGAGSITHWAYALPEELKTLSGSNSKTANK